MALAIKFQDMVDRGEVRDYADLSRLGMVTRARLTQIMNLTLLAPEIQERILLGAADVPCERLIRSVAKEIFWSDQRLSLGLTKICLSWVSRRAASPLDPIPT